MCSAAEAPGTSLGTPGLDKRFTFQQDNIP